PAASLLSFVLQFPVAYALPVQKGEERDAVKRHVGLSLSALAQRSMTLREGDIVSEGGKIDGSRRKGEFESRGKEKAKK
ncbi:Glutathione hydrolase 1 proenzyme, partial [Dissostichus eleginoides]